MQGDSSFRTLRGIGLVHMVHDGVVSRNTIAAKVTDLQSVAESIGRGFRAVFLWFGAARIRNGCVQTDAGVSGRLGEPASGACDRLLAGGERNHQGLENEIIEPEFSSTSEGKQECRERLGGLLRYYYRDAA